MGKLIKIVLMSIIAIAAVLFIMYLQVFGTWTTLIIDLFLMILFLQAAYKSSRYWRYWIICVIAITYLLSFAGLRVRHTPEGRIQVVSALYPICPKVYIEGTSIDTIEIVTGYGTFAGWYYNVQKSKFYAIRDTTDLTTLMYRSGEFVLRGHHMVIEDYKGPHGTINIFNYIDDDGKREKRDFFGNNPDDESYSINVMDNADYIPDYIP